MNGAATLSRPVAPRLESLQALRALAALLVVMFHTQVMLASAAKHHFFFGLFTDGNRGVDLFFVLSGFIITYVHIADIGRPSRAASYAYNRLARIYPLVWIVTLLTIVTSLHGSSTGPRLTAWNALSTAFLLPNAAGSLVDVMWSLKCEIFFYIIFFAAIVRREAGVTIALAWQSAVLVLALLHVNVDHTWYGLYLQPFNLEFGIGIAGALLYRSRDWSTLPAPLQRSIFLVGLCGFLAAGLFRSHLPGQLNGLAGVVVFGACAGIIVTSLVILETNRHVRIPLLLAKIGGASYAIYLVHYQIITHLVNLALRVRGLPVGEAVGFGAALTGVVAGLLLDRYADQPVQRALRKLKRRIFAPSPALLAKEPALLPPLERSGT